MAANFAQSNESWIVWSIDCCVLIFVVHANSKGCRAPSYWSLLYEAQAFQVNISCGADNWCNFNEANWRVIDQLWTRAKFAATISWIDSGLRRNRVRILHESWIDCGLGQNSQPKWLQILPKLWINSGFRRNRVRILHKSWIDCGLGRNLQPKWLQILPKSWIDSGTWSAGVMSSHVCLNKRMHVLLFLWLSGAQWPFLF
jgi:hypothetical protein